MNLFKEDVYTYEEARNLSKTLIGNEQVEKEFEENQSKWYDKDGRVYPLQQVAPKHWVALPEDMAQEAELEEREEKESD